MKSPSVECNASHECLYAAPLLLRFVLAGTRKRRVLCNGFGKPLGRLTRGLRPFNRADRALFFFSLPQTGIDLQRPAIGAKDFVRCRKAAVRLKGQGRGAASIPLSRISPFGRASRCPGREIPNRTMSRLGAFCLTPETAEPLVRNRKASDGNPEKRRVFLDHGPDRRCPSLCLPRYERETFPTVDHDLRLSRSWRSRLKGGFRPKFSTGLLLAVTGAGLVGQPLVARCCCCVSPV